MAHRQKQISKTEQWAVARLLAFGFQFGRESSNSIADWAIALVRGHVTSYDIEMLEDCGLCVEQDGERQYVLKLSNALLKQRDSDINSSDIPYNTLLRRIGGWSGGTVRLAGKPQRVTVLPWKLVWQHANRYKRPVSHEPLPSAVPLVSS